MLECRVDYIETTPHVSRLHHLRIVTFMGILLVSHCNHALPNATTPFRVMELAIEHATPVQPEEWHVCHTCCMRLGVLMMLQLPIPAA